MKDIFEVLISCFLELFLKILRKWIVIYLKVFIVLLLKIIYLEILMKFLGRKKVYIKDKNWLKVF